MGADFERLFPTDRMSKLERVMRTLAHQEVDRVALLDQLSYSPAVIGMYAGKEYHGFEYGLAEIGMAVRLTLDLAMPVRTSCGTGLITDTDGFVYQNDYWTSWRVSRPFHDEHGAAEWVKRTLMRWERCPVDPTAVREKKHAFLLEQRTVMGQTVIMDIATTGFCTLYDRMGLEIFSYFTVEYADLISEYMEASICRELIRIDAAADPELSPVILIAEDFATKQGPIFSPEFLGTYHYPYVKRAVDAWRDRGIRVLYHSDGNWRKAIPDLAATGVEGFYCLEPTCGMDIVEFKNTKPDMVWAGGVDGVDLMERGTPAQVAAEVCRHIRETRARESGGMFVASSSEINPTIPAANYRAMVEAVKGA